MSLLPRLTSLLPAAWVQAGQDLRSWGATVPTQLRSASRLEAACMSLGVAGMALALCVSVAQATLSPLVVTEDALRRAVVAADFDGALCPDGWAADHAGFLGMTEAEVTAWYLRESFQLSDQQVITNVGFYLANATDFRQIEGPALTRNQILLCVAESRRLTQPLEALLPPHLRTTGTDA
ncbi:hypothetical protein [Jannaschia sp. M317]|uniref:hypothetical protein n=1 Tax=Jannaschia sp. M317 TaxID=2867011 RepID=UPI0021A3C202|nr:hypothetical protein [Jannaschia sp. M317]UWQ19266.1 hypothetical protein K3551_08355 [Jannaschia sp. M317]